MRKIETHILLLLVTVVIGSGMDIRAQTISWEDGCILQAPLRCEGWSPAFKELGHNSHQVTNIIKTPSGVVMGYTTGIMGNHGWIDPSIVRLTDDGWIHVATLEPVLSRANRLYVMSSGQVAVIGWFRRLDGNWYNGIALWDGTAFQRIGDGYGTHSVLAVDELPGGDIVMGGGTVEGGLSGSRRFIGGGLVLWNGESVRQIRENAYVRALRTLPDGTLLASWSGNNLPWRIEHLHPNGDSFGIIGHFETTDLRPGPNGQLFAIRPRSNTVIERTGTIMRWDGAVWHNEGISNAVLSGGEDALYAMSRDSLFQYVDSSWTGSPLPATGSFVDLFAVPGDNLLLAGGPMTLPDGHISSVLERSNGTWSSLSVDVPRLGVENRSSRTLGEVSRIRTTPEGSVVAVGWFTHAGGIPAQNVAKYDSGSWETLGSGIPRASVLFVDGSRDIWTESFRWDGTVWQALPDSMLFLGYQRTEEGSLYGVGRIVSTDGSQSGFLAREDRGTWTILTQTNHGENQAIHALTETPDGSLVLAGRFTEIGGVTAPGVARWQEGPIEPLPAPVWPDAAISRPGDIDQLHFLDGHLYALGNFVRLGGGQTAQMAELTEGAWTLMGGTLNGQLSDSSIGKDGQLYIAGSFEWAGDAHANGIARWNGSAWESPMKPTEHGTLRSITADAEGRVFAGFQRHSSGLNFAPSMFSYWMPPTLNGMEGSDPVADPNPDGTAASGPQVYPNPTTGRIFVDADEVALVSVEVLDSIGRRVLRANAISAESSVDLSGFASGLYFVRITAESTTVVRPIVLRR